MAPNKRHPLKSVFAFASAIVLAGVTLKCAVDTPAWASDKDTEVARTAKLTDSPEASGLSINKMVKSQAGAVPASLAKLYDYDPPNVKLSKASTEAIILAPQQFVWDELTNFNVYPRLFPRLKTCQVVKKEGDLIYIESLLKPQMFVTQPCQHTINDLEDKPDTLKWKLTDGNFKAVEGEWKLESIDGGQHTKVRYTMEVDPGPMIPRSVIVLALKMVQKEAVGSVKASVEQDWAGSASGGKTASANLSPSNQR